MIATDLWAKLMEKLTPAVQEWTEKNYTPNDNFRGLVVKSSRSR
jgi:hypothetical protein